MDLDTNYNQNEVDQGVYYDQKQKEEITAQRPILNTTITDEQFIKHANFLIRQSEDFYKSKYNLPYRQAENFKFFFGRQLDDEKLKSYQARFVDNIIWESMAYLKPMALSQMPDMLVTAANNTEQSKRIAKVITDTIDSEVKRVEYRRALGVAFKHRPVYFYGVIKALWNPEKGTDGDYDFVFRMPQDIILDHTAQDNNPDNMTFIAEYVTFTVKEWVMRFPKQEQAFYDELRRNGVFNSQDNENNESGMNSKVKGIEIWFDWYEKKGEGFRKVTYVGWYYKNLVFDRIKHPYWDWQGEVTATNYQQKPIGVEEIKDTILGQGQGMQNGQNDVQMKKVFRNHFQYPRKPYIILGYDQFGKVPIDETSEIEQARLLQATYDKRGMQVTDMLNRARGKHVFSEDAGLKAEDLQEMDFNNPDEDILVKGDVRETFTNIQGEQPSAPVMENLIDLRQRIFAKMGTQGPSRGDVNPNTAATNTQLAREGDFSRADDLTEETINRAALEMGNWIMQFIKLFYNEDHFKRVVGKDGEMAFNTINRDYIEDGMELQISASGTDKLKLKQQAADNAKLQITDPMSYYQDMEMADPQGRAEKLILFTQNPMLYLQKFVYGNDTTDMLDTLNGQGASQAYKDIQALEQGQIPPIPAQVYPGYFQVFSQWMNSPRVEEVLKKYATHRMLILQFAKGVAEGYQAQLMQGQAGGAGGGQPQPGQQPAQGGPPMQQGNVGPTTGNPQPGNTAPVPITPGA